MPQLDDRLAQLAGQRPPVGAGALINRIESRMADAPNRRVSPALHPVRAMTMAALAVLVFVGGVAVGHWAFGSAGLFGVAFGGAGGPTTTQDVSVLATVVAGASGGAVLLAGALSLGWTWRRRRRTYRSSIDRGGTMETMEKKTQDPDSAESVLRINRWMAVGLVLALAALVALGAWLLIDNLVQTDYEKVLEDHLAAQNAADGEAVAALYTEDGVYVDANGHEWVGRGQIASMVKTIVSDGYEKAETIDLAINEPMSMVASADRVTWSWGTFAGISVFEFEGNLIKRCTVERAVQLFD